MFVGTIFPALGPNSACCYYSKMDSRSLKENATESTHSQRLPLPSKTQSFCLPAGAEHILACLSILTEPSLLGNQRKSR